MLSNPTTSNLAEALLNVRKIEKNFINREFKYIDRDRNKIRAHVDRHKETFLQLTRKRHETWYRHDKHFREGLRKEKEYHEKRKAHERQRLSFALDPNYMSQDHTPFQPRNITDDSILPPIVTTIKSKTSTTTTEPMTKIERYTYQVLRASQKLLDESAARPRYKFVFEQPSSSSFKDKNPQSAALPVISISNSVQNRTSYVPMRSSSDCEEYDQLINESLQRETFSEFVDHFVKFRPEFREQFASVHEENKRQKIVEQLRRLNRICGKTKDERYHNLLDSLTDVHSE
ncbi:unnamed protein product [Adineta steineri]|uniref:Uncharacterized protein n=1 Tax=Adineta steineri TaxID=433720 RepID=A0A813MEV3_9BILA|nr:unnamed protein product [Adineta steineri]CAF1142061.1 unnamed protein product [Adineta steineri]